MPSFLGYSSAGNVSGNLVYVNYGMQQDFNKLRDYGVSLNGSIALIRYGKIFRGIKVYKPIDIFRMSMKLLSIRKLRDKVNLHLHLQTCKAS